MSRCPILGDLPQMMGEAPKFFSGNSQMLSESSTSSILSSATLSYLVHLYKYRRMSWISWLEAALLREQNGISWNWSCILFSATPDCPSELRQCQHWVSMTECMYLGVFLMKITSFSIFVLVSSLHWATNISFPSQWGWFCLYHKWCH